MQINYDKFSIQLESDRGKYEIIEFLRQKKFEFTRKDEKRILLRLRYQARKMGYRNFKELLNCLKSDPQTSESVFQWLEKGRAYHEEDRSFVPLIRQKITLKDYVTKAPTKPKKKKKKFVILPPEFESNLDLPADNKNLSLIFDFLSAKNINYQAYKKNHFLRRLHARMKRVSKNTYKGYYNLLQTSSDEFKLLMDNFSINVTRFFRDKELFLSLEKDVIPQIMLGKKNSIRIWSAGCAVGPEPYSIAILLNELKMKNTFKNPYILATDINQGLLQQAMKGVYSDKSLEEVDKLKILKYFQHVSDSDLYQLSPRIRNMVTFKQHDLRTPTPGRDFDLILCRNVLIYFSRAQSEIFFKQFHAALKSQGYLVLGRCEVLPQSIKQKFEIIDTRNRIYKKKE
ncbi:MAG: CheR family methyltransferase [Candidatus Hodarchaeales archaeon]|jgi:chemotaxis protein methyltransferase CheR